MVERYLLFKGDAYYPSGGWHDFKGSFSSIEAAVDHVISLGITSMDWYHVVDSTTGEIVKQGRK
jgi:hypothetical protein